MIESVNNKSKYLHSIAIMFEWNNYYNIHIYNDSKDYTITEFNKELKSLKSKLSVLQFVFISHIRLLNK